MMTLPSKAAIIILLALASVYAANTTSQWKRRASEVKAYSDLSPPALRSIPPKRPPGPQPKKPQAFDLPQLQPLNLQHWMQLKDVGRCASLVVETIKEADARDARRSGLHRCLECGHLRLLGTLWSEK